MIEIKTLCSPPKLLMMKLNWKKVYTEAQKRVLKAYHERHKDFEEYITDLFVVCFYYEPGYIIETDYFRDYFQSRCYRAPVKRIKQWKTYFLKETLDQIYMRFKSWTVWRVRTGSCVADHKWQPPKLQPQSCIHLHWSQTRRLQASDSESLLIEVKYVISWRIKCSLQTFWST